MPTLETMRQRLRDELFDADDDTWNAGEKDDILQMAVRQMQRRAARPIDPEDAAASITLVSEDYFYDIDSSFIQIDRVFYIDSNSDEIGYMVSGWEVVGDLLSGNAKLHVSPTTVEAGGTLRLHGWGRYTLTTQSASQTNAILEEHVPYILSWSKARAFRRLVADRARFRQWQNSNQVQNISVNELMQIVNNAEQEAADEWVNFKRWQKPTVGRQG